MNVAVLNAAVILKYGERYCDAPAQTGHQRPVPAQPRAGRLQGNPKIHKGVPLRVIVSGNRHATERVAELAEEQLRTPWKDKNPIFATLAILAKLKAVPQPL